MLSSIVLRVRCPTSSNNNEQETVTEALEPSSDGISLGALSLAAFGCVSDPLVDSSHGTLERTPFIGVWVYSDHSNDGSKVNGKLVHNDAAVVHNGDTLQLGDTEIELCLQITKESQEPQEETEPVAPLKNMKQEKQRVARRRASTPWAVASPQQAKQRLPRIETSGLGLGSFASSMTTPPEYTASPIPGATWRRKRNSIASTTFAAQRSPSPPMEQQAQPHSAFHRPRTRFVQGETPPRQNIDGESIEKVARPPPLEYTSSPVASPTAVAARQRHNLFQQPPATMPNQGLGQQQAPSAPFSAGARPTARRDDLRIQVSKKMAAAAPASVGKPEVPRIIPKVLEFQPPQSPVAQRDIKRQQESLQTILQHKFEEEQLLKQQQEEWMRRLQMPASSNSCGSLSESPTSTPPLSPIKGSEEKKNSAANIDAAELAFFPRQTPVLQRTISLGLKERTIQPSPRLTAAIRASRSRVNTFEERSERRKNDLTLSPKMGKGSSQAKRDELRTSDDSVSSSATTVITCHRRVTRLLSLSSGGSADLGEFSGYEDDEDVAVRSYTAPDLYGSAEFLRRSRDDTTLLFDQNREGKSVYGSSSPPVSTASSSSATAGGILPESPCRRGPITQSKMDKPSPIDNQPRSDSATFAGSRVWSPRGGQFNPESPYKSTAAFKIQHQPQFQKLRRPEDAEEGEQGHPSFRRRRHSVAMHHLR